MTKNKYFRKLLWGHMDMVKPRDSRSVTIIFPAAEDGDVYRSIQFRVDDGVILYLIRRIEKLEAKVEEKKPKRN